MTDYPTPDEAATMANRADQIRATRAEHYRKRRNVWRKRAKKVFHEWKTVSVNLEYWRSVATKRLETIKELEAEVARLESNLRAKTGHRDHWYRKASERLKRINELEAAAAAAQPEVHITLPEVEAVATVVADRDRLKDEVTQLDAALRAATARADEHRVARVKLGVALWEVLPRALNHLTLEEAVAIVVADRDRLKAGVQQAITDLGSLT